MNPTFLNNGISLLPWHDTINYLYLSNCLYLSVIEWFKTIFNRRQHSAQPSNTFKGSIIFGFLMMPGLKGLAQLAAVWSTWSSHRPSNSVIWGQGSGPELPLQHQQHHHWQHQQQQQQQPTWENADTHSKVISIDHTFSGSSLEILWWCSLFWFTFNISYWIWEIYFLGLLMFLWKLVDFVLCD